MARNQGIPVVAVVGAGASGSLVALHLVRAAGRRSSGVEIVVIDPADRWGEGVAFSTADERHLLNVPAAGMSALPEDPGHFVSWRRNADPDGVTAAGDFAPRVEFARYLGETLREAVAGSLAGPLVRRVRDRATTVQRLADGLAIGTAAGRRIGADALVLASGIAAPGTGWAVPELRDSAFFVADPWAPGALEVVRRARSGPADVLLVGTGLTMVDVVRSLGGSREDRVLHAVSRHGRLPARHADTMQLAAIPDIAEWGSDLDAVRHEVRRHLATVARATGDWRPAMDGLRFRVSELWARFDEADRERFLSEDVNAWNVARHRMPPQSAEEVAARSAAGELVIGAATVRAAEPLSRGGLKVTLSDGRVREVGWVVNCTGPDDDVRTREDPLLDDLRRPRGTPALAVAATAGMGLRTVQGRLIDSAGDSSAPIWTLGSLRRGELWESTAIPEIRHQALAVATAVLDTVAPPSRRLADGRVVSGHHPVARPRDLLGLPLSTSAEAAASFNEGLERVLRLQSGGDEKIREATQMDPDFAIGHAALAMLGHEAGASADVAASLTAAQAAVAKRGDDRERSWVGVVTQRVDDVRYRGGRALMNHIAHYPRDVLAVSAAVPTIAFSGVTDVQQEAWDLVEGLAPAYGDHWWYISLLAFTRQDQSRFDEAGLLAESALSCEPSSGHAVHALTHVMYETGQHEEGRVWLDHWVEESGTLGDPSGPLLLARGTARARARRPRGRAQALLLPAGAAAGVRGARARRRRGVAVALASDDQ